MRRVNPLDVLRTHLAQQVIEAPSPSAPPVCLSCSSRSMPDRICPDDGMPGSCSRLFLEAGRRFSTKLCLKNRRAMARQGKNRRKSGVYREVNEPFEPIFNAVWASAGIFQTKRNRVAAPNSSCKARDAKKRASLSNPVAISHSLYV